MFDKQIKGMMGNATKDVARVLNDILEHLEKQTEQNNKIIELNKKQLTYIKIIASK